jgi:hypothetical protein
MIFRDFYWLKDISKSGSDHLKAGRSFVGSVRAIIKCFAFTCLFLKEQCGASAPLFLA